MAITIGKAQELLALSEEKGALSWKPRGMSVQGWLFFMPTLRVTRYTRLCKPGSVAYRTGLRHAETEIRKRRAETGAEKPPIRDRYGWFTESFDTLDLKEAKALLDALHA